MTRDNSMPNTKPAKIKDPVVLDESRLYTTFGDYMIRIASLSIFSIYTKSKKIIPMKLGICFKVLAFLLFNKCLYVTWFKIVTLPSIALYAAFTSAVLKPIYYDMCTHIIP